MSNIEIPTHPLKWGVSDDDLSGHKYPGDSVQQVLAMELKHQSAPSITHGNTYPWKTYGGLTTAEIKKKGPYESGMNDGHITACSWGSQGKKHSEIFSFGFYDGSSSKQVWLPTGASNSHTGITGFGFEIYRQRTDSKSYTNENCKNWMAFLRRFGARFVNRTTGNHRFWTSDELATDGLPLSKFGTPKVASSYWYLYEFYNCTSFGSNWSNGEDWMLESIWFNITNREIAGTGTATPLIWIYNLQFYSDFGVQTVAVPSGSQRIIRPAEQALADRNICALGGLP